VKGRPREWLLRVALSAALWAPIQAIAADEATSPPTQSRLAQAPPTEALRYGASPAIYQYIQLHRDSATGRMEADAMTLPDEPATRRFSRLRWVPGALEGLGTRHMQWDGSAKASQAIVLLRADDVVTFYNDALDFAAARVPDAQPRLHELARRLATTSRDRGPVKFGIAMLGSMGDESDLDIVRTLAIHDEFGLYAAQAIAELAPQRQQALFDMAQHVSGWGRIEAVALMTATPDAKIRRWLLTEGFRNDVTAQYLAYHCATIADLADAISDPANASDPAFLTGVSDLIQSLIKPGPSRDSQAYSEIPAVAVSYLQDAQGKKASLSLLLTALVLNEYAAGAPWNEDEKASVKKLAAPIIADKGWRKRVIEALSDDRADLEQAELAARKLDIETFALHLRRLEKNGAHARRWSLAFTAAQPRQLASLVNVAERTFGARFAKGAVGRANTSDAALEAVLQGVAKSPGVGIPIVDASLLDISPVVRRAAVETLVRWGGLYLRDMTVRAALSAAADEETDEALKARMVALLNVGDLP
jgi:hypothetical protein